MGKKYVRIIFVIGYLGFSGLWYRFRYISLPSRVAVSYGTSSWICIKKNGESRIQLVEGKRDLSDIAESFLSRLLRLA